MLSQRVSDTIKYSTDHSLQLHRAEVIIDGFAVRGNVQFEVMVDGNWIKGHRENSQYGQIFRGKETTFILTDEHRGRVSLPLVMDMT